MSFFRNFGYVSYKFGNEINPAIFQNLSTYIDVIDQVKDNLSFYELYYIRDDVRPDNLSYELYGTNDFYWTFYLLNEKLRQQGWPLSEQEIFTLGKKYYPNIVLNTTDNMFNQFFVGDICARVPFSNPPFKARILAKDYNLGQVTVKQLIEVRTITVTNGGSGYTSLPTVTISGGSGYGAQAAAVLDEGSVSAITVTSGGEDYVAKPTVTISEPNLASGTRATATANLSSNNLPSNVDLYSVKNEYDTTLWNTSTAEPLRFQGNVTQLNSIHHLEDFDGNIVDFPTRKDIDSPTDQQEVDNTATGRANKTIVRVIDELRRQNDELRTIKILTKSAAVQINAEYQRLLRNNV